MSVGTWIFKKRCIKADGNRDKNNKTPDTIKRFDDITYGENTKYQILDVYRPKDVEGELPVIVSVHGGGWVYGDKEVYQYYCMSLAKMGFVVVNFTYRLAPKYKHPAQLEDTNLVFAWILAHAKEYGMDVDKIFAVGDSAGATILGLYVAFLTNEAYRKTYPFVPPTNLKIRGLGLNCGIYNMHEGGRVSFLKAFLKQKGTKSELDEMSLIGYVTKDFPPCYVMTATEDYLKNEAPALVKVLEKNKVPYEYKIYGTKEKPLYHVFHCDINSDEACLANKDECEFFMGLL